MEKSVESVQEKTKQNEENRKGENRIVEEKMTLKTEASKSQYRWTQKH